MTEAPTLNMILLVDDDRVTNLMHKRQISRCGLAQHVETAADGMAALEFLADLDTRASQPPEIILLDINMPRMNGFEFLKEYAHLPETVRLGQRVILVSTSTLKEDSARANDDPNVHEFINKPLTDTDLRRVVEDYCAAEVSASAGAGTH